MIYAFKFRLDQSLLTVQRYVQPTKGLACTMVSLFVENALSICVPNLLNPVCYSDKIPPLLRHELNNFHLLR